MKEDEELSYLDPATVGSTIKPILEKDKVSPGDRVIVYYVPPRADPAALGGYQDGKLLLTQRDIIALQTAPASEREGLRIPASLINEIITEGQLKKLNQFARAIGTRNYHEVLRFACALLLEGSLVLKQIDFKTLLPLWDRVLFDSEGKAIPWERMEAFFDRGPIFGLDIVINYIDSFIPLIKKQKLPSRAKRTKYAARTLDQIFQSKRIAKDKAQLEIFDRRQISLINEWMSDNYEGLLETLGEIRVMNAIYNIASGRKGFRQKDKWVDLIELDSWAQFYEAVPLEKRISSRGYEEYSQKERRDTRAALQTLQDKARPIIGKRYKYTDKTGEVHYEAFLTKRSLIQIAVYIPDITGKELVEAKDPLSIPDSKVKKVLIKIAPELVDQYNRYYTMLPSDIYGEIKAILPTNKYVTKPKWLFIAWIHHRSLRKPTIKIHRYKLADQLGLQADIERRRWTRIDGILKECYDIAIRLGYLEKYELSVDRPRSKMDVFHISPTRIPSSKRKEIKGKA